MAKRLVPSTYDAFAPSDKNPFILSTTEWTKIQSLRFVYVASATAASRYTALEIDDPSGNAYFTSGSTNAQTASTEFIWQYDNIQTQPFAAAGAPYQTIINPGPIFWLPPNWSVNIIISNAQAGDNVLNLTILHYATEDQEETLAIAEALGISDK